MQENFQVYINIAITIVVSGFITYFLSYLLAKIYKWLVFLIPAIMLVISVIMLVFALTTDQGAGLASLGIIILFLFALLIFIVSLVTSFLAFKNIRKLNIDKS